MTDVIFLSSVFGQVKIAEPMGVSILTAHLRARGRDVTILEPSVAGWSVEETVGRVAATPAPIVGISVLRDKNVPDVRRFVSLLRDRCPERFLVMGGHGPSISVAGIPDALHVGTYLRSGLTAVPGPRAQQASGAGAVVPAADLFRGPLIDPALTDRGKGPGDIGDDDAAPAGAGAPRASYYDLTPEYLRILRQVDVALLGESDTSLPDLVDRVLAGAGWRDLPGVAYVDEADVFRKSPLPPKLPDLDAVPFMARDVLRTYGEIYQRSVPASILSSRGCFYRCTFCSVVQYEKLQDGLRHRQRSNASLISEIRYLHETFGTADLNFEDDNFIVKNKAGIDKVHDLCDRLIALEFPVRFTFFCRADVVERDLFAHLRAAGLNGIYFGLESVYAGDLDFFHKGLSVEQMFTALDVLAGLGFSPAVDADLRIMLGYITWHPLTSFASLRASSDFIRRYCAPPKLLRRKLRVYAGTEVVSDVARLGLLDPDHTSGWRFQDSRLDNFDLMVDSLFQRVDKVRDSLRTLEKAAGSHGYRMDTGAFRAHRLDLDAFLCDRFDSLVDAAAATDGPATESPAVRAVLAAANADLDTYCERHDLHARIAAGYQACGFDLAATDLFRK